MKRSVEKICSPFTPESNEVQITPGISDTQILYWAERILQKRFERSNYLTSPDATREFLRVTFADDHRELFAMILLDNQHSVIGYEILFLGTIDGAAVYPREVVKTALNYNAAAVIFTHNHPSGVAEPSQADRAITARLKNALDIVDIQTLDHLVVGGTHIVSFAERGLIDA
ncbi:DNA repair protein RadC [Cellvibrio sp. PSBB006]|uniref:RadC family protein n=1 Tax=Cellvibrio sp. PSBB006 TaxID=1987723 RepID=UPI0018E04CF9|nr:DNA repair protein RadC [Cellvibrio sp. PSBB006]